MDNLKERLYYPARKLAPGITEYGGAFSIELCPDTPMGNVPVHDTLQVSPTLVLAEYGRVLLFRSFAGFRIGGAEGPTFWLQKLDIISIKTGTGQIIWHR